MGESETVKQLNDEIVSVSEKLSCINMALEIVGADDRVAWQEMRFTIEDSLDALVSKFLGVFDSSENYSADQALEDAIKDAELLDMINKATLEQANQMLQVNEYIPFEAFNIALPSISENSNLSELKDAREQLLRAKIQIEAIKAQAENAMREASEIQIKVEVDKGILTAEKIRLAQKASKRRAEITVLRNGLQDVCDSESAFSLREKFFALQLVLDDEERSCPDITYLLSKSMDDVNHALEIADLKRRIIALVKRLTRKSMAPNSTARALTPRIPALPDRRYSNNMRRTDSFRRPPSRYN